MLSGETCFTNHKEASEDKGMLRMLEMYIKRDTVAGKEKKSEGGNRR